MRHYNFGVEIESIGKPYGGGESFTNVDWYRQLAQKLQNRGIEAVHDDCSRYSKHPEYYGGKWFVTRDGSLKRPRPYVVCMEVVSPRLDTTLHLTRILSDFWEAMRVHFNPQKDQSCGGHVHVTPVSRKNKFKLRTLKQIAFASIAYEDFMWSMLPPARRENQYCKLNSQSSGSGVCETLAWGKSTSSLKQVASEIKALRSETDIYMYMQGNRYVLWNFQNIFPHPKTGRCTGTVEFRGGNQFLGTKGTLAWVAFVLGFITLATKEVGAPTSSSSLSSFILCKGSEEEQVEQASSRRLQEDEDEVVTQQTTRRNNHSAFQEETATEICVQCIRTAIII
ncbi:swim zinc finger domain protein [Metarhizium robertsii ARSEF 23]|uniref:Swim zinc finger domain protein n=1 Tax=Metarhizium robertsii (strain ARSEF 23 / ATCC MYA-3075) TaxID=655844 RepID=E9EJ92_METRA|nr:swim zinc finger domain protein [Metarhizium robertsii ARSEF 23]EFZ03778.2 swim zinc finger domain protein [Metarhizium robertsii ARSEF 23]